MILVLFEPDIPQNTGSFIRLAACMATPLHIIEPCGFPLDDKRLKRASMDYYDLAEIRRHRSWQAFLEFRGSQPNGNLLLLSAHAKQPYTLHQFHPDDMLLFGRESAGVPDFVRQEADISLNIPMRASTRSLNVAMAASMVLGEALRQTNG